MRKGGRGCLPSVEHSDDGAAVSGAKALLVSPERAIADLARAIRLRCMRRRELSLGQLAADSGVAESRLRKFLSNDPDTVRCASLAEALSIWGALDASAATASLAIIDMRAEDNDAADDRLGDALADMMDAGADLARVAADGKVDFSEADKAEHAADVMIDRALVFREQARKARAR